MEPTSADETRQNSGRLIAFSDGVVAIAITLMILPLADISLPSDNDLAQSNPLEFVWQQNGSIIVSFLIGWFVILMFWLAHHDMFGEVERVNSKIIKWNVLWLFGIIILPFPLNLLDQVGPGASVHSAMQQTTVFYIGALLFISLMLSLMSREIRRNPSLLSPAARENAAEWTTQGWINTWYLLALLPVAWFAPQVALWALIGLMAIPFISNKVESIVFDGSVPPKKT